MFIGGSAVIFISLIANYSDSRRTLIESTIKVILVKFVVSPYSPINAYFAVILQAFLGYILFWGGFNRLSAILLGFFSLLFSALQKIIILTLVFGMTLWESIDIFFNFILTKLFSSGNLNEISFSYFIVGLYMSSHIIGGLIAGWYASILPNRLNSQTKASVRTLNQNVNGLLNSKVNKKKKKKWWLKPSSLILFLVLVSVIFISFIYDDVDSGISMQILIMFVRSVIIIFLWYYFISPILVKVINKYLLKKRKKQSLEIENIINYFPNIKSIIKYSWDKSNKNKGLKKFVLFVDNVIINFLLFDKEEIE